MRASGPTKSLNGTAQESTTMKALGILAALIAAPVMASTSATLSGELAGVDCDARADIDDLQTTSFDSNDGTMTVYFPYTWADGDDWFGVPGTDPDYQYTFKLTDGNATDQNIISDSNNGNGSGTLDINLNNSNQWYKKQYSIQISAYAVDVTPGYSCQDSDSDSIMITLRNTTFAFDTETVITAPSSSVFKWDSVTVSGYARSEPPSPTGSWEYVADGTNITLTAQNGGWQQNATVQTSGGQWSKKFSCPTRGWDMDFSWTCKAELASGQQTKYLATTSYNYSSDNVSVGIFNAADLAKQAAEDTANNNSGHFYNPFDNVNLDTDIVGFDSGGTTINTGNLAIGPGSTSTVQYAGYNGGGGGSVELQNVAVISTYSWGSPATATTNCALAGRAQGVGVSWGSFSGRINASNVTIKSDPPPDPVDVRITVYDAAGTTLGDRVYTIDPHAMVTVTLPDDIPGLPASGSGSVLVEALTGEEVLSGTVQRKELQTGAVSADRLTVGLWPKIWASLVDISPARSASLVVHNPSDVSAEVAMQLFNDDGTPAALEPSMSINAHGTYTFDVGAYVGPTWRGSAQVELLSGDGVSGTILYDENSGAESASMPMLGEAARRVCLPIVGESIDWDGLYCVHNPNDTAVTGRARFRNADGSIGTEQPVTINPHGCVVFDSNMLEAGWIEPWATFDFDVTGGDETVVGGALLSDPLSGNVVGAACEPVPEIANMSPQTWEAGWNLIAIPADPIVGSVESTLALAAQSNSIERMLYGYTQPDGYMIYPLAMETIRRGGGYWLYLTNPAGCEYACSATPQSDFSITLDEGWTIWGYPFLTAQPWSQCSITDGTNTYDPATAETMGWIQQTIFGYSGGAYFEVPGSVSSVEPWRAYWILAHRPGLQLVVPTP
jgi:hypothetical protein